MKPDSVSYTHLDVYKRQFLTSRKLPDPMTAEFANAVQEALSGLEKIAVKGDEIKQALLQGGSPATPDDLRKRFDTFMNERCKGKDCLLYTSRCV